jgi:putative transcriptional regulator
MGDVVQGSKKPSCSFNFPGLEVKAILERIGVSQEQFALVLGVGKRTIKN